MTDPKPTTPSFRRFGQAQATPPAATATKTPEPEVKQAEVVKEAPKAAKVAETAKVETPAPKVEQRNALSVFAKPSGANALAAFCEVADEKPQFDLFPVVIVAGGNNGGQFDAPKHMSDELKRILPSGRKPIPAVVLAYRMGLIAYPSLMEEGSHARPSWTCVIPSHEGEATRVATKLARNYQFTKKANRGKFDFETSGVGHVKPMLSILCYLPDQNLLVEVRTPANYSSVERSGQELGQHFNQEGSLEPFPCEITVETVAEGQDKANPWKVHHLVFKAVTNDTKKAMGEKFSAWQSAAQDDQELVGNYNKWLTCTDRPLTDEIIARLQKGVTI